MEAASARRRLLKEDTNKAAATSAAATDTGRELHPSRGPNADPLILPDSISCLLQVLAQFVFLLTSKAKLSVKAQEHERDQRPYEVAEKHSSDAF